MASEDWGGLERYERMAKIGEGTFGVVYKAKVIASGRSGGWGCWGAGGRL